MRDFFRKLFINLAFILVLTAGIAQPVQAQTSDWSGVCVGDASDLGVDASDVATIQGLECLIANIFTVFLAVIGLAGFVMFIVGSFRWMLSGGTKGLDVAKGTMTTAIIGIVLALSAFIILNLVAQFTGVQSILTFSIPTSD